MSFIVEIVLGIILCLLGALINNFGLVFQRRQVKKKTQAEESSQSVLDIGQFFKDPIWDLGILMQTILYLPFIIISIELLGITLFQPLSNAGIIFLILGLILMVNEKLKTKTEILGICVLIFGVIAIVAGGVVGDITLSIFFTYIFNFWIIMLFLLISSLISLVLIIKVEKTRLMLLGFIAGNCYALVAITMQLFTESLEVLASLIGITLLILSFAGAVVGTVFGILATQEAFKRGQAINIVPFSQIPMNIIPIIAGLIVFKQGIINPIFFWVGVIAIIVGATLLARFMGETTEETS